MPNQILQDTLNTTTAFIDTNFEIPLETEILLADYDLPVFKIVRTAVQHTVTQKYINGSRLIIEGFFRVEIFYQSSSPGHLTSVSKKIPFQKNVDFTQQIQPPYFVIVEGDLQYINTRAVNSSRIESNGVYRLTVRGYRSMRHMFATAVDSTSVCVNNKELKYFSLCGRNTRQFSVESEISFGNTVKILHVSAWPSHFDTQLYEGKVNVKGDIAAEIIYSENETGDVRCIKKSFRCNQMIDIAGIDENCIACPDVSVIAVTITRNNDTGIVNCIVSSRLEVKVFRQNTAVTVTDAFSRLYRYSAENNAVPYDNNINIIFRNTDFSVEDDIGPGYRVVWCTATSHTPVVSTENGIKVLKSLVSFSAVVRNERGEYECFTKNENVVINTGEEISEENDYFITVNTTDCTASVSGEKLNVKTTIIISGFVIYHSATESLNAFEENKEKPADTTGDSLVLYYGKKGEKLFDIAKRYKTDIKTIETENAFEGNTLPEDRILYIPSFSK